MAGCGAEMSVMPARNSDGSSPARRANGGIAMQRSGHDRRMFVANSLRLATSMGAAAAFGLPPRAALAQTAPRPIRRSERYDDSFITERKPY